jgi:serine/threonine protein kinase
MDPTADPLLGSTLSRTFVLQRLLGEGGMGRVYEATHTRIKNKRFAIKVLHPELAYSAEVRGRFHREAEAAACISHPNAVSIFDVAETPQGWPYLVCEYLDGLELAKHLKDRGALPPVTAQHIGLQVGDALLVAHAEGLIHRDLKPQNVFLVGDFTAGVPERPLTKVLDFGLSRFLEGTDTELTKTGAILGTPSYMAPEQARGERADHRVDIYGLGALLYAMVTGRAPFRGDTPQGVLLAVLTAEPPRPSSLNPLVSVEFELVIQRAMAKDPNARYPDMKSLLEALAALELPSVALGNDRLPSARSPFPSIAQRSESGGATSARSQLLGFALLTALLLSLSLSALVEGTVVLGFGRWPLSTRETVLVLLVVVGTLFSPAILLVRRVRQRIWGNTAHVMAALLVIRRLLAVATLTYGVSIVFVLFADRVISHLALGRAVLGEPGLGWPGMPLVLFVTSLVTVLTDLWRVRLFAQGGWVGRAESVRVQRRRRFLAGSVLLGASIALAALVLLLGLVLRGRATVASVELPNTLAAEAEAKAASARPQSSQTLAEKGEHPDAPSSAPSPSDEASAAPTASQSAKVVLTASPAELRTALAKGLPGLEPLGRRYPDDPAVLRALGVQYAATASGLGDALGTFRRLFEVAPAALSDKDVRQLILQMIDSRGPARYKAYDLLATGMGSVGPDLLYKIALTRPQQKADALKYLGKARERGLASPALAVAHDLHFSRSCADRLPMLERAAQFGDERSVQVLNPLSSSKPRGCGRRGRDPCKPTCPKEAEEFQRTIEKISLRPAPG